MNVFDDARQTVAGKLAAAGVPSVTLDPTAVAPFVLVGVPDGPDAAGGGIGGWSSTDLSVIIAAVPPGNVEALAWLLDQLELVLRTLGSAPFYHGIYDVGGKDLPAYSSPIPSTSPIPTAEEPDGAHHDDI